MIKDNKDIGDRLKKLSPEQKNKIFHLLNKNLTNENNEITKREKSDAPLSSAQEGLWTINQLDESGSTYNMPYQIKVTGRLNIKVLRRCFNEIFKRHEILRSFFILKEGMPRQYFREDIPSEVSVVDLQDVWVFDRKPGDDEILDDEQQSAIDTFVYIKESFFNKAFDLEKDFLLDILIVRFSEDFHLLLMNIHHLIFDGYSYAIFLSELRLLYTFFLKNEISPLSELPIQYGDYSTWQRNKLQDFSFKESLNYWKKQLKNLPDLFQIPSNKPRPKVQLHEGGSASIDIPKKLIDDLLIKNEKNQYTLFMHLTAIFYILLYRYTGEKDIPLGSIVSDRHRPELQNIIGYFISTVILRLRIEGSENYYDILKNVKKIILGTFSYPEIPFNELNKLFKPKRSLSYSPWFQIMINFLPVHEKIKNVKNAEENIMGNNKNGKSTEGVYFVTDDPEKNSSKFDLTLAIEEEKSKLIAGIIYDKSLYEESVINRLLFHYVNLLKAIIKNPYSDIDTLNFLGNSEKIKLLNEWKGERKTYFYKPLIRLFEKRVEQSPNLIAAIDEHGEITYKELNNKANQVAAKLLALGCYSEDRVCLCIDRCLDMLIGFLGILKIGAIYVPIDPLTPEERFNYILKNSKPSLIVTQKKWEKFIPDKTISTLFLDSDITYIESVNNPNIEIKEEGIIYIIYTSGSTGMPKGVMNTQVGLHNRILWMQDVYQLKTSEKILHKTPINFDTSFWELIWPLIAGASVVMAPSSAHKDPFLLGRLIDKYKISILDMVPSMLDIFLDSVPENQLKSLRILISGGEALSVDLARKFHNNLSKCKLYNMYGPTETAIGVSYWLCTKNNLNVNNIPIGKPIANTKIYILDSKLQLVPIGTSGEICIAGLPVGCGYWLDPELTSEKFVSNPYGEKADEKLYRTGDLGRHFEDGSIEYLGRMDRQLKIRGFRIELTEIESSLRKHEKINEAMVLSRKIGNDEIRLIAYVLLKKTHNIDKNVFCNSLRAYLKNELPDYMLPSGFIILDKFPLTEYGKVDLERLKTFNNFIPSRIYNLPCTPIQHKLVELFASLLNLDVKTIGIEDDFFDLGGHSLLLVKLMFEIKKKFKIKIEFKELFNSLTVKSMEGLINSSKNNKSFNNKILDLREEILLDGSIVPENLTFPINNQIKNIFLTGATGFLGIHLLCELLRKTTADIYCLIRASNLFDAKKRLSNIFLFYEINDVSYDNDRIKLVVGNLESPNLGVSDDIFNILSEKIDVIYHNGANLNIIQPYNILKKVNVEGTRTILNLACRHRTKFLHYISTPNILNPNLPPIELFSVPYHEALYTGYAQSKWVAEQLLNIASKRGLPVSIYRPYRICGHSKTGAWNTSDIFCEELKGVLEFGKTVIDETYDNMVPVDYVSQAVVHISKKPTSFGKAFHLTSPRSMPFSLVKNFFIQKGFNLEELEYKKWRILLNSYLKNNQNSLLLPYSVNYPSVGESEDFTSENNEEKPIFFSPSKYYLDNNLYYEDQQSIEYLSDSNIICPMITIELWDKYYEYFIRSGFLKSPVKSTC